MSQHPQQHCANILPNCSIHFSTSSSCDKPQRLQHRVPGRDHILQSDTASPPPSKRSLALDTCRSLHSNYTEMPYSLGEWSPLCTAGDSILDSTSMFLSNTTQIFFVCSNIKKIIMSGSPYLRDLCLQDTRTAALLQVRLTVNTAFYLKVGCLGMCRRKLGRP